MLRNTNLDFFLKIVRKVKRFVILKKYFLPGLSTGFEDCVVQNQNKISVFYSCCCCFYSTPTILQHPRPCNFYFTYSTKMGGSLEASHCADGGNRRGEFEVSLQCFHSDNLHHHYHLHYHRHRQYYHKHIDVQYVSVVLVVKLIYLSYTKSS